jgi:hypothetical protein
MGSTGHLMGRVGVGDVDGQDGVGSCGGVGGDGVVACYRGGLGAEGSELAGESVDLIAFLLVGILYTYVLFNVHIPQLPAPSRTPGRAPPR